VRLSLALLTLLPLVGSGALGCSLLYNTDALTSGMPDAGTDAGTDAATDAGTDAATDADPGPGGPSLCAASPFVFCDGFEKGYGALLDNVGGGAATTDTTHVYRGTFALRSSLAATVDGGGRMAAQVEQMQTWPPHVFVRVFAFVPTPVPPQGAGLLNYLDVTETAGLSMYVPGSDPSSLFVSSFGVPSPNTAQALLPVALGGWICVELEVDSTTHAVNVWVDGDALNDLSETVPVGSLGILSVGLNYDKPPAGPAYEAWFDEAAVDTTRIGCAR
jgi:hypothetical protein